MAWLYLRMRNFSLTILPPSCVVHEICSCISPECILYNWSRAWIFPVIEGGVTMTILNDLCITLHWALVGLIIDINPYRLISKQRHRYNCSWSLVKKSEAHYIIEVSGRTTRPADNSQFTCFIEDIRHGGNYDFTMYMCNYLFTILPRTRVVHEIGSCRISPKCILYNWNRSRTLAVIEGVVKWK